MTDAKVVQNVKQRESGLELYRIISMILIVAHHYVVLPGIIPQIIESSGSVESYFMILFGMWGKVGIDCFVLITGYYMCTTQISLRKFLKLLLTIVFWNVLVYFFFLIKGDVQFSAKDFVWLFVPIRSVTQNFAGCYLLFFILIPFVNILIKNLNKQQHLLLVVCCLFIYTILSSIGLKLSMNYVSWFTVVFLVGAYLRLYPEEWFNNNKIWGILMTVSLAIAVISVFVFNEFSFWHKMASIRDMFLPAYFWVNDAHKIMAVLVAVTSFMFFKTLNMKYNKYVNIIATATFGVLIIHSNSSAMMGWLWSQIVKVSEVFGNAIQGELSATYLIVYSFCSVFLIYMVCTILELLRLKLTEKPILDFMEKIIGGLKQKIVLRISQH